MAGRFGALAAAFLAFVALALLGRLLPNWFVLVATLAFANGLVALGLVAAAGSAHSARHILLLWRLCRVTGPRPHFFSRAICPDIAGPTRGRIAREKSLRNFERVRSGTACSLTCLHSGIFSTISHARPRQLQGLGNELVELKGEKADYCFGSSSDITRRATGQTTGREAKAFRFFTHERPGVLTDGNDRR